MDFARDRVVDVRCDDRAGRVAHVGELLRQVAGGEEVNARFAEAVADDQGEKLVVVADGVDHG